MLMGTYRLAHFKMQEKKKKMLAQGVAPCAAKLGWSLATHEAGGILLPLPFIPTMLCPAVPARSLL